jgi:hypothetical protein
MTSKVLRWLNSQPLPTSLADVAVLERQLYASVEASPDMDQLHHPAHVQRLWATLRLIDALALEFGADALAADAKSFEGLQRVVAGEVSPALFWRRWYDRLKAHRLALWENALRAETYAQAA